MYLLEKDKDTLEPFTFLSETKIKINLKILGYSQCLNLQQVLLSHHTVRVIMSSVSH